MSVLAPMSPMADYPYAAGFEPMSTCSMGAVSTGLRLAAAFGAGLWNAAEGCCSLHSTIRCLSSYVLAPADCMRTDTSGTAGRPQLRRACLAGWKACWSCWLC